MKAVGLLNGNWRSGMYREYVRDLQEQVRPTPAPLPEVTTLQIALDVANGVIENGLKYEHPGMIARGKARVEEVKARVWEIVRNP